MSNKDIKRVTGIGGFFFKTENPNQIKDWYKNQLGIPVDSYDWTFWWKDKEGKIVLLNGRHLKPIPSIFNRVKNNS